MKETYWKNICEIQQKQTEKGINTYGQSLEENSKMSDMERLVAIEEELIDALMYIEHLKAHIEYFEYGERKQKLLEELAEKNYMARKGEE